MSKTLLITFMTFTLTLGAQTAETLPETPAQNLQWSKEVTALFAKQADLRDKYRDTQNARPYFWLSAGSGVAGLGVLGVSTVKGARALMNPKYKHNAFKWNAAALVLTGVAGTGIPYFGKMANVNMDTEDEGIYPSDEALVELSKNVALRSIEAFAPDRTVAFNIDIGIAKRDKLPQDPGPELDPADTAAFIKLALSTEEELRDRAYRVLWNLSLNHDSGFSLSEALEQECQSLAMYFRNIMPENRNDYAAQQLVSAALSNPDKVKIYVDRCVKNLAGEVAARPDATALVN